MEQTQKSKITHSIKFLDDIIDGVITPTYSFTPYSVGGFDTPKSTEDAKPLIEMHKEGLRRYREFYVDLLEFMKAHPTFSIKNENYPFYIRDNSITKDSPIYLRLHHICNPYIYDTHSLDTKAFEIFIQNIDDILNTDVDEYIKYYNETRYSRPIIY